MTAITNGMMSECALKMEMQIYIQFEPTHDKTNKMTVCPAKTQISLGIPQSNQSLRCALNG